MQPSSNPYNPDYASLGNFSFGLSGGYLLVAAPRHQLRLSTSLGWSVTTKDSARPINEGNVSLSDLPLSLSYTGNVASYGRGRGVGGLAALTDPTLRFGDGAHRTWINVNASFVVPTGTSSREYDKYFDLVAGLGVRQQILLRPESNVFSHLLLGLGLSWRYTSANDQTFGLLLDRHQSLSYGLSARVNVLQHLQWGTGVSFSHNFYPGYDGTSCLMLPGGCIKVRAAPPTSTFGTTLSMDLSYLILPELALSVQGSYSERQSDVFSPLYPDHWRSVALGASAIFSFDQLYTRLSHRNNAP